jgi:5'-3' exonuclease
MDVLALIDCDSLLYKNIESLDEYKDRIDELISQVVVDTNATHYKCFIEHPNNFTFRKILYPSYKINRRKAELPVNYREIKDYIIETYSPFIAVGVESDDAVISTLRYVRENYPITEVVLAVNDKDYHTFPCTTYDLYYGRLGEIKVVSEEEANYNFWNQMIQGDASDGVLSIKGIGKKGAEKILSSSKNYFITTYRMYKSRYGRHSRKHFEKSYNLLKLRDDLKPCKKFNVVEFKE